MKCFPWVSSMPATSSAAACLMGALSSINSLYSSRACAQQQESSWPHSYHMQRSTVATAALHVDASESVSVEVPHKPHAHMPYRKARVVSAAHRLKSMLSPCRVLNRSLIVTAASNAVLEAGFDVLANTQPIRSGREYQYMSLRS